MAVRTWAPVGQTPVRRVNLTRDHLAAIRGITPDGPLVMQVQDRAYRAEDVVRFLRLLLRKISGKLLVIWDGAPIHRGQAIKAFLRKGAAKRLHLEQLPGYAPELNPAEGLWNYLKRVELAISAVLICPRCGWRSAVRKNACGTNGTSCGHVLRSAGTMFSLSHKHQ